MKNSGETYEKQQNIPEILESLGIFRIVFFLGNFKIFRRSGSPAMRKDVTVGG